MNAPTDPSDFSPRDGLEGALYMARRGVRVFRLARGTKNRFLDKAWTATATASLADIFDDWRGQEFNVGCLMTGHIAVDVDVKDGKPGLASLADIEPNLPRTYRQRTPSGGQHIIYKCPPGVQFSNSVCQLADGLDVRGLNGYVLGPGSEVDGGLYEVLDPAPIAEVPPWLAERLNVALKKDPSAPKFIGEIDTPSAMSGVAAFLMSADSAVEGAGGNVTTYAVANACMDRGVWPETTADLMLEHWNDRCSPPWDHDDLRAVVENAAKYRQNPIGCYRPEAGFEAIDVPKPEKRRLLKFARDVSMDAIRNQATNATIKGLFGPKEIILTYGESTAAKTFAVADRCWHIAMGLDWQGRKTKKRPVLYVCLEGEHGFEKRMEALKRRYGDPGDYFAVLNVPVTLIRNPTVGAEGVKTILAAFQELLALTGETTGHIALDTLSRAIAGDNENSAEDMMHFIAHRVDPIRHETGASFEIIHHTNKMGDLRGSSSLKPAVDCMMRIDRDGPLRTVTAEKVKDGEDGAVIQSFTLEQVCLGMDDDGVPITSCTVRSCETPPQPSNANKPREGRVAKALRSAYSSATAKGLLSDVPDPETGEVLKRLEIEALRPEFYAAYWNESSDTKRRTFGRLLNDLPVGFKRKKIGDVDFIWLDDADWS